MKTHYFLAVSVPEEMGLVLNQWLSEKKEQLRFRNWVDPADYHITLYFLGDATDEQLKEIKSNLPNITGKISPFLLQMDHFGVFGKASEPSVFWSGLREEADLADLHRQMARIYEQAGFVPENRPYRPHVTLARKWEGNDSFAVPAFPVAKQPASGIWKVEDVVLYRSHLHRSPRYEAIARFPLNG